MTTHSLSTQFCIIGGGLSGVSAALAAAREGIKVVLVQDRSVLGGNASSEIKMHIVGADCHGNRPGAREGGIIEEFRLEDSYRNPHGSFSQWDLLLYEKVTENENITLLLDSDCVSCETETVDGRTRITSARVLRNFTEDEFIITAPFFADCSGDGRLGVEAGADFRAGREAQSEFNESFALPEADNQTLGCSILFTARQMDQPQPFVRPHWVRQFRKEEFKLRPIGSVDYGFWWAEWGGQLDTIKDGNAIRHELLRILLGIWDYVKNSGEYPHADNWLLDWVGSIPGKRESRRFLGDHILTQDDVMGGRIFDDQVAYGGWWLDLHPPNGVDAIDEQPCMQHHMDRLYSIPLRSLYSRNIDNLFFAGRNISATHVAFASTRVMATCSVMGQAVGTAVARLLQDSASSCRQAIEPAALRAIQQQLVKDDAFLLGIWNQDESDLARSAACAAPQVLSGPTREFNPIWGDWTNAGPNAWESESLPAQLDLSWPEAQTISELHLTFCSGFQRELILSPSAYASRKSIRGPQPEIIKDYDVYLDDQKIVSVRGNYLRKRVHRLEQPVAGRSLRIEALATQGHPVARIFEVRAY